MCVLTILYRSMIWFILIFFFFFSSRRRHTRCSRDWSSDVCSSDLDTVIEPAEMEETDNAARLRVIFESAVTRGLEGIMAKRPDSPYTAGARNFNWIKLKRSYKGELSDTADLCLVGDFRGRGKRARFGIGAVLAAAYDPASDSFKTVSRIGTGFSDEGWVQARGRLREIAGGHKPARGDSEMEPDVWGQATRVVTVAADEINRSPLRKGGADA